MKILLILALLLTPLTAWSDTTFIGNVADEIQCSFTLTADNTDKTSGTTMGRVIRLSDAYYWNWNTSAFDSASYNASNHDGSLTYRGQSGATYKGNGWSRAWTPPTVSSETVVRLECVSTDAYNYMLKGLLRPEDAIKVADNVGINLDDTSGTIDAAEIGGDAITSAKIADDAIAVEHIAANAIGASEIAADAIGASEIATDAVGAAEAGFLTDSTGFQGADVAAILTDTGTTLDAALAVVDGNVDSILVDTAVIGAAGAGLTDLGGMSTGMKAEVNTEADTALTDYDAVVPGDLTTVAAVVDGVWDEAQADHVAAGSTGVITSEIASILVDTGTTLDAALAVVDGNVDSILVDTGTTLDAALAVVDGNVDSILTDTGTTLDAALAVVDGNVDSILTDTGTTLDAAIAVIDANIDEQEYTKCDVSASTSGTSFTIATCTDHQGNSITPGTDSFVGSYMKAYTNGGSDCNVIGESVFVSDLTANVVTVKTADMPGSGFSATPNTSNCGIIVTP